MKRVVITGMGGVTAFGDQLGPRSKQRLEAGRNAVRRMTEWDYFESLHTRLACPLPGFVTPAHYPRKKTRSMGPVSLYSVRASELALADAGLADDAQYQRRPHGRGLRIVVGIGRADSRVRHDARDRLDERRHVEQLRADDAAHERRST